MAIMPDNLRLTPDEQQQLTAWQDAARKRHERARKAAAKRGRKDFPLLPWECTWHGEEVFRKSP